MYPEGICRLCEVALHDGVNTIRMVPDLQEAIKSLLGIEILPTDKCSQNVCRLCASKVVEYKIFRKRAIATQDNISDYQQINAQVQQFNDSETPLIKIESGQTTPFVLEVDLCSDDENTSDIARPFVIPDTTTADFGTSEGSVRSSSRKRRRDTERSVESSTPLSKRVALSDPTVSTAIAKPSTIENCENTVPAPMECITCAKSLLGSDEENFHIFAHANRKCFYCTEPICNVVSIQVHWNLCFKRSFVPIQLDSHCDVDNTPKMQACSVRLLKEPNIDKLVREYSIPKAIDTDPVVEEPRQVLRTSFTSTDSTNTSPKSMVIISNLKSLPVFLTTKSNDIFSVRSTDELDGHDQIIEYDSLSSELTRSTNSTISTWCTRLMDLTKKVVPTESSVSPKSKANTPTNPEDCPMTRESNNNPLPTVCNIETSFVGKTKADKNSPVATDGASSELVPDPAVSSTTQENDPNESLLMVDEALTKRLNQRVRTSEGMSKKRKAPVKNTNPKTEIVAETIHTRRRSLSIVSLADDKVAMTIKTSPKEATQQARLTRCKSMAACSRPVVSADQTSASNTQLLPRNAMVKVLTPDELNYRSVCSIYAAQKTALPKRSRSVVPGRQINQNHTPQPEAVPHVWIPSHRGPTDGSSYKQPNMIRCSTTTQFPAPTQSQPLAPKSNNVQGAPIQVDPAACAAPLPNKDARNYCIIMRNSTIDPTLKTLVVKDNNNDLDLSTTSLEVLNQLRQTINQDQTVNKLIAAFKKQQPDPPARAILNRLLHPIWLQQLNS